MDGTHLCAKLRPSRGGYTRKFVEMLDSRNTFCEILNIEYLWLFHL